LGTRSIGGIIDVQHSKQRSWKKQSGHLEGPLFETISRKLFRRRSGGPAGVLFTLFATFMMAFMLLSALSGIG
jgi:hypothetical protein